MNQKGFALSSIIFIIIGAVVIASAVFGIIKYKTAMVFDQPASPVGELETEGPESAAPEGDKPEAVVETTEVVKIKEVEVIKEVVKEIIKEVPVTVPGSCPEPGSNPIFFNIPASNEPVPKSTPGLYLDLVIKSLNFYPPEPIVGDAVTFWTIVKNQGEGNAANSFVVRLSIDGNFWAEATVAGLASGKAENIVWDKKWKASNGKYMLKACIEDDCVETDFIVSKALALSDYIIESASIIPNSPVSGDILSFSTTVKNQGNVTGNGSSFVSLKIDINNDGKWDIATKDAIVDVLVPSGKEKEDWKWVWAATQGTHKYQICADSLSMINESDETNNCQSVRFVIK